MITKHELNFDPADGNDHDIVASFLKAADGTLITHTGAALDVNIKTSDIAIDVDLDHTTGDSVQVGDGTDVLEVNADGSLNAVVTATDLDIRDLAFATDSIDVTGSEVSLDAATLAALETITVVATDLDIRDLSHTQDSVQIGDGTDLLAVEADGSINVNASESGYSTCAHSAITVTSSATDLVATDLTSRKLISIQNLGQKEIYIGCDNTVTAANGTKVPKGGTAEFKLGAGINVHAITPSGTADVRILEFA